jgi:hypothetical protein
MQHQVEMEISDLTLGYDDQSMFYDLLYDSHCKITILDHINTQTMNCQRAIHVFFAKIDETATVTGSAANISASLNSGRMGVGPVSTITGASIAMTEYPRLWRTVKMVGVEGVVPDILNA